MIKKIVLHIGTEKTGTTSIQHALAHQRTDLIQHKILYPVLFGSENHMEIAVYAMDDNISDELRQSELNKSDCSLIDYRQKLREKLEYEIEKNKCDTIIISNEHCHSRLSTESSVLRLAAFLNSIADKVEVIVYLRRQDKLAISHHSTRLKLGGIGDIIPEVDENNLPNYFLYGKLLDRYSRVFGSESLTVKIFEPKRLVYGSVVSDFYNELKLPITPPALPKQNESLSLEQGLFLTEFNKEFPLIVDDKINNERGDIFEAISQTLQGHPYMPARQSAEKFYNAFSESNSYVKNKYFPALDRKKLFDDDFSSYPEDPKQIQLQQSDIMQFVFAIWKYKIRVSSE